LRFSAEHKRSFLHDEWAGPVSTCRAQFIASNTGGGAGWRITEELRGGFLPDSGIPQ
jgi:hypothetical protein